MIPSDTYAFGSTDEQQHIQLQKLRLLVNRLHQAAPHYRRLGLPDYSLSHVNDIKQFPCTTKEMIEAQPTDFYCVPSDQIAEYTATTGTQGQAITVPLTSSDLHRLALNESRSFAMMGVGSGDTVQLMLTLDRQFMAGMAYYNGALQRGATVIRSGPGLPVMQWDLLTRYAVTTLVAVPSMLQRLFKYAKEHELNLEDLSVSKVLCIGENIRQADFSMNPLLSALHQALPVSYYSTYASTEMQTAFTECAHGQGGHLQPDLLIAEIIDDDGQVLPPGQYGELCITTLGVEAMPLLRYRTGDICCLHETICVCGRRTPRISPVMGRRQQRIKWKGTTLYPPAVFDVLQRCSFVQDYVLEVRTDAHQLDELTLFVSCTLPKEEADIQLRMMLQSYLRVSPVLVFLSLREMEQRIHASGQRKAQRFFDYRRSSVLHDGKDTN